MLSLSYLIRWTIPAIIKHEKGLETKVETANDTI